VARWLMTGTRTDIDSEQKSSSHIVRVINASVVTGDYVEMQWDSLTINCGLL